MNVVHVSGERGWGGGEVQATILMRGLKSLPGLSQIVVAQPDSALIARARAEAFDVYPLRMKSHLDLAAAWRLRRLLGHVAPPVLVHAHDGRAAALVALADIDRRVATVATRHLDLALGRGAGVRFRLVRAFDRIVAPWPAVHARLAEAGVPESRIADIPAALDTDRLTPRRARELTRCELGAGDDPVILTVGSLVPLKGFDTLLEAVAGLTPPPHLWIAGNGPEGHTLTRLAHALGIGDRVQFLGRRDNVADLMVAADVVALPSRREAGGLVAIEAMALGRPVVASRVGGLALAVEDGVNGVLVPPDDPDALAAALVALLRDGALRERLGAAARRQAAAEDRSPAPFAERHAALYRAVIESRQRR